MLFKKGKFYRKTKQSDSEYLNIVKEYEDVLSKKAKENKHPNKSKSKSKVSNYSLKNESKRGKKGDDPYSKYISFYTSRDDDGMFSDPKRATSHEDLQAVPIHPGDLKSLIKEGVKEAQEEQKLEELEAKEQAEFIQKAKPKYYEQYADLQKIVKEAQGKFNIHVDNRKSNSHDKNLVLRSKKKFEGMIKDEIVERRLKAKKLEEKERRRMKNFKKEVKIERIKKQKQIEDVMMNEIKREANIKAQEERNQSKFYSHFKPIKRNLKVSEC